MFNTRTTALTPTRRGVALVAAGALVTSALAVLTFVTAPAGAADPAFTTPCVDKGTPTSSFTVPTGAVGVRATLTGDAGTGFGTSAPFTVGSQNTLRLSDYSTYTGGRGAKLVVEYALPAGTPVTAGTLDGGVGGTARRVEDDITPASKGGDAAYVAAGSDCSHVLGVAAGGGGAGRGHPVKYNAASGVVSGTNGGDAGIAADGTGAAQGGSNPSSDGTLGSPGGAATATAGGGHGNQGRSNSITGCKDGTDGVGGSRFQGGNGAIASEYVGGASCIGYGSGGGGAGLYGGGGGGSARGAAISAAGGGGASFVDTANGTIISSARTTDTDAPVPAVIPIYQPTLSLALTADPVAYGTSLPITATVGNLPSEATTAAMGGEGTVTFTGQIPAGGAVSGATVPVVDGVATWKPPVVQTSSPIVWSASYDRDLNAHRLIRQSTASQVTQHFDPKQNWVYATGDWTYGDTPSLTNGVTCTTANGGTPLASLKPGSYVADAQTCTKSTPPGQTNIYYVTINVAKAPVNVRIEGTLPFGGTTPTYEITQTTWGSGSTAGLPSGITLASQTGFACDTTSGASFEDLPIGSAPVTRCIGPALIGSDRDSYQLKILSASLLVTRAPITITPLAAHTFGTPVGDFDYFANLPDGVDVTGTLTCTYTDGFQYTVAAAPAGSYGLVGCTGLSLTGSQADNYKVAYAPGTYLVDVADLPVTITGTRVFNGGAATFQVVAQTLPAGVTVTGNPVCTLLNEKGSGINGGSPYITGPTTHQTGSYTIDPTSCSGLTLSGANRFNYALSYNGGAFTVTTPPAIRVVVTGTWEYGEDPELTYGVQNPVDGYPLTGTLYCGAFTNGAEIANHGNAAGTYPIDGATCTGLSVIGTSSYPLTYVTGSASQVTITKAPLTVTASDSSGDYRGNNLTAVTPTFAGFKNGDDFDDLVAPGFFCTTATGTAVAGFFAGGTSCSSPAVQNYTFTFVNGDVTVRKARLDITAPDKTYAYGTTPPAIGRFEPTYSGFLTFDNINNSLGNDPTCSTNTTSATAPGVYPDTSTCSGATSTNYEIHYHPGKVTVTGSSAGVTAPSFSVSYGDTPDASAFTPTYSGISAANLTTPATCSSLRTATSSPGTYPITCTGAAAPGFSFTYTAGTLTVTQRELTIKAPSVAKVYGAAVPALPAPTYTGFAPNEGVGDLTTPASCSSQATTQSPVTPLISVNCSGAVSPDYSFIYVKGSVVITPAPLTIKAVAAVTADNHVSVSGEFIGLVAGDQPDQHTISCSSTVNQNSTPGTYPTAATCQGFGNANYDVTFVPGSVTIRPTLRITAAQIVKKYGDPVPAVITPQYSGFVDGDNVSDLDTPATCSSAATAASNAQTSWAITCGGATSAKYYIVYPGGTAIVVQAALVTVTATADPVAYGTAPTVKPSYAGFVLGEDSSVLTTKPTCTSTAGTAPGTYTDAASCSGAAAANYGFSYVKGDVVIGKTTLLVTPESASGTYGTAASAPAPFYTGFLPGDTAANSIDTAPTCVTNTTATTPAGSYPATSSCSGGSSSKYELSYAKNVVTIAKKALTVTGASDLRLYGAANPALPPAYDGFVNGDSPDSLTSKPTCTTTADAHSGVGNYPVVCAGGTAANYDLAYVLGVLKVRPTPLRITATTAGTTFRGGPAVVVPGYDGFVNGEGANDLTTKPTCSSNAPDAAGTYPGAATCAGAADANYTITYVAAPVTVGKRALTITASDGQSTYGSAAPVITAGYTGLAGGDEPASSLSTLPTCAPSTDAATTAGVHPDTSTCSGAVSANYDITYAKGTVTIAKKGLTVTAPSPSKVYGSANPGLPPAYSGFVNGEAPAALTTAPTCSTTGDASSRVNTYPVTCSGGVSSNYAFTYVSGTLTITKAPLTVTASNAQPTYGDVPVPVITASYGGFVNGDAVGSLTTRPTCSSNITPTTAAGVYLGITTCAGAASDNYAISYVKGNITVTKAPITVTAGPGTQQYGAPTAPAITSTVTGLRNGQGTSVLGPITCSANVDKTTNAGTYPSTSSCTGASSANYQASFVNGTVTVTKAAVVVTAGSTTSIWGTVAPVPSSTLTGFRNSQTRTVLTAQPACVTTVTSTTNAGTYTGANSCSGAAAANYSFTYVKGNAVVTKADLIITPGQISVVKSFWAGKMTFTAKVTHKTTGAPVAGVPVTFATTSVLGYTLTCTGTSNAQGVTTCTNGNGNFLFLYTPKSYTGKAPAATNYNAATGTGVIHYG